MLVQSRYHLPKKFITELRERPVGWGFGQLSEAAYYRTYSREFEGRQEAWADTVIRVVEGVMSIRKDHLTRAVGTRWDETKMNEVAVRLADAIFDMRLLPPGRGLWAMGTDFVYERGSHALNNCAFVDVTDSLSDAASWLMDSLMCGVGVGFGTRAATFHTSPPVGEAYTYVIPDTREGWAESVRLLVVSYEDATAPVKFDYSEIRKAGQPIRGFGGVSSGAGPLRTLHKDLRTFLDAHAGYGALNRTRLITDVMNAIGVCVVAGNVRRSAEIAVGNIRDDTFINLKNYSSLSPDHVPPPDMCPDPKCRCHIGWMSNNTVALETPEEFELFPEIAPLIGGNGEPGVLNLMNVHKYGRMGEKSPDLAVGVNPCGEIPLESYELCNLVEVFPTRCSNGDLKDTMWLATFYASTVALLRSHSPDTNEVVARNRRIGVSVSGIADWIDATSVSHVFGTLNRMYEDVVRPTNRALAREAGVPASIRVTTVKPSGTVSLLAGVSSGVHWPVAGTVLRRMRVAQASAVAERLEAAGVPHEPDVVSSGTEVFEFPLQYGRGRTRSVKHVSVFEQALSVAMLQRCWADNAVSNTLTVQPEEQKHVERVLAFCAPLVKSISLLPDRPNVYDQMPLEQISKDEFDKRSRALRDVDWSTVKGEDAIPDRYCENDVCEVPQ